MFVGQIEKKCVDGKPTLISLFTCGMGMDIGFEKAGFATKYANDITKFACDTIRANKPRIACDEGDITNISSKQIISRSSLKANAVDVIIGGPPCQSFSTAGLRKGLSDKRGKALLEFIRIIREIKPKIFIFENVPGLVSIPKEHISFYERASMDITKLSPEQKYGSLFKEILNKFNKIDKYEIDWKILNAADYGVPQKRKRLIIIGSRIVDPTLVFQDIEKRARYADPKKIEFGNKKPWKTLKHALAGLQDDEKECVSFPKWGKYLKYIPPGGCWIDLPPNLKKVAMGGAADSNDPKKKGKQGGRRGFYRRLSWDVPAPTLVTSPTQLGSCICHPDEHRPLSVKEYARIQGFPDKWKFYGSTPQKYRMIGEAVPIELAKTIGQIVKQYLHK